MSKATAAALGAPPEWDLSDLFPGPDSVELKTALDEADAQAAAFSAAWAGRLTAASADDLARAVAEYEQLQERFGRLYSYAQLLHAGDLDDPEIGKFQQGVQERVTAASARSVFFTLELNRIAEADLEAKFKASPALARYRPWLRDVREHRPHDLADEMERLLHEKHVAGAGAWMRLFDETMARLRFPIRGEQLTSSEALNLLSDRNRELREAAAHSIARVLNENVRLFSLLYNTLIKEKEIDDRWRAFPRPISARNLSNLVEDEVVDALVAAVREAYPRLSHRYYAWKAKKLGLEKLQYWDRNAPLPKTPDRVIPWSEATDMVMSAYARFSPQLAETAKPFFDNAWIDAPVRDGKANGAFAHPTTPSAHPYLLLNYQGKARDVMTLAHELGHGVHQLLAAGQGALMADTPLTLAETASVFGEMLTFRALLDKETDAEARQALLASKVEDMLNTVVRQIAMCRFETRAHDERRAGEITATRMGEIWMETQREALGPAFDLPDEYAVFWSYIPHFIHSPFYVYAYAFGDCLVNSLYAVYEHAEEGFAERYLEMLRAGGAKRHKALLAPFQLDASDPDFWRQGLRVIEGLIDEIEAADQ